MLGLIIGVIAGAILLVGASTLLPESFRNALTVNLVRVAGALLIAVSVLSTSFVHVPDGHLGQMFRIYGGSSLSEGRIVATDGENGPQAHILTPGFHFWPLVNVLYTVDTDPQEILIPSGKVGVLSARDGSALRAGQAFADPFPAAMGYKFLDAEVFLKNGGQRGPQLTVLTPGKYRLNRYLWDVSERDAKETGAGFVGVVKSNVHADIDFGTLRASKPEKCDLINRERIRCSVWMRRSFRSDASASGTSRFSRASIISTRTLFTSPRSIPERRYGAMPAATAVPRSRSPSMPRAISLQTRTEVDVPVTKDNADRAVIVKMEGWDVPLELRVVAQVSPTEASCVVASVGTLKEIEDRVLTPSIRAITRDVAGGSYEVTEARVDETGKPVLNAEGKPIFVTVNRPTKVLDLINQRPLIEGEIERRIRPEGLKSCVTIREVRLGEPAIPPELLVAVRREQLATQLAKAFIQEKGAQEKRIESDKAKATADQQSDLVRAEIAVQTSVQNAQALRNQGQGERDRLTFISEGQRAQTEVLGADATVKLRQYELILDRVFGFVDKNPNVLAVALANAHKFVPERVTNVGTGAGGGGDSLLGAATILGDLLNPGTPSPRPAAPAAAPAPAAPPRPAQAR